MKLGCPGLTGLLTSVGEVIFILCSYDNFFIPPAGINVCLHHVIKYFWRESLKMRMHLLKNSIPVTYGKFSSRLARSRQNQPRSRRGLSCEHIIFPNTFLKESETLAIRGSPVN